MATVVDLFAGCGGLSKGFEEAGFNVVAAFENWGVAADCYEANFGHKVYREDLGDVPGAEAAIQPLNPDIIIGGPPCQDFSSAGKRTEKTRASLTHAYATIVSDIRPKMFLMENVDRAYRSNTYAKAREIFKTAGYGLTEKVLTASYCGVPQRRKRFFCIGVLGGEDAALGAYLLRHMSQREMTVRDYLGDGLDIEYYYRHPRNYSRRAVFSIDEPAPTMRGVNRPVPKGYPGHPGDACEINESVRPLTTLERSLIQTFPPEFKWTGSKTDREQMIGNAVPVKLGAFVANAIREYMEEEKPFVSDNKKAAFAEWLQNEKGYERRTASSIVSNLQRINNVTPLSSDAKPRQYLAAVSEDGEFKELAGSVKSHMRQAARLYFEWGALQKA